MEHRTVLASFLSSEFLTGTLPDAIPLDYDLVESGVVDSLGLLKIVSFIEDRMQISIEPEAMTPDNFKSLGAMLRMLGAQPEPSA